MHHDDGASNLSRNTHYEEILAINLQRRRSLQGGSAAAALGFFGVGSTTKVEAVSAGGIGFALVPASLEDTVRVPLFRPRTAHGP